MQTIVQQEEISIRNEKAKACQTLIDKTIEKLAEQLDQGYSDAMKQYLKAMSFFHQYSINNLFLIMVQKPDATRIAGFRTWKKLNRQVKKGEKGIRIFAPVILKKKKDENIQTSSGEGMVIKQEEDDPILYFRTVCVFDISQTDGDGLPETLKAQGDATELIPQIEQSIRNAGIELEYGETFSSGRSNFLVSAFDTPIPS